MAGIRDMVMYIAIFGLFSFVWFGWAQESPRKSWRKYIGMASGLAFLVCLIGVYYSVTHWHEYSVLNDDRTFTYYLIFFYGEFILAGIGAFWLIRTKRKDYIAPWVAFVVGVHFIGLKSVFQDGALYVLAVLLIAVSVVSIPLARKLKVASSAITGIGAGTSLFCFALLGYVRFVLAS